MSVYEIEYIDIKHESHPTIRMEIKKMDNYYELTFEDMFFIIITFGNVYGEANKCCLQWKQYIGPNTIIDSEDINAQKEQQQYIHAISSAIEYIKQNYSWVDTIDVWGDSGSFDFAMFDRKEYDNSCEYYYYNLALFGETWFEKYFKAEIPCSDYKRIKTSLFLDPNFKNKSWDSFKCKYHIHKIYFHILNFLYKNEIILNHL
jgi:hypothetical protein